MPRFVKNCCLPAFMVGYTSHTYPYEKSHLLDACQSTSESKCLYDMTDTIISHWEPSAARNIALLTCLLRHLPHNALHPCTLSPSLRLFDSQGHDALKIRDAIATARGKKWADGPKNRRRRNLNSDGALSTGRKDCCLDTKDHTSKPFFLVAWLIARIAKQRSDLVCPILKKILLANDTNSGIDRGSDFHLKSLQRNTSALDQLGKALVPLRGNWLLGEIIPYYTPCFIRQQFLNVVVPIHATLLINEQVCRKTLA